jgi:hypothetical protein
MIMKHPSLKPNPIRTLSSGAVLFLLMACASNQYKYVPAEHQKEGKRSAEAVYSEPSNESTGKVRVEAKGITELEQQGNHEKIPALHVRMAISNNKEKQNWYIYPKDQFISFPNQGPSYPILIRAGGKETSQVEIKPTELKTIELYFPLPGRAESESEIPEFDFHWRLKAGQSEVKEVTLFDRITLPIRVASNYPYGYDYPFGWESAGWGGSYFMYP